MGAVAVDAVGKAYKQYADRWSRLSEWVLPGHRPRYHLHWVLRDVTFDVEAGEAVGIIGANGAGKSTLLKLITGTTQSTTGAVRMSGRVAALLELGMGFHPDFTGRQNAYMAGQLLGFGLRELEALMPAIEAFAGIGEYMDQPVRTYSSGMQVRLAFSVATARRPDILIVDEALSVGDAQFQLKSFDRIREFQSQGTTLLLVSHDLAAIRSICDRVIWLDKGAVRRLGETRSVVDEYLSSIYSHKQNVAIEPQAAVSNAPPPLPADFADCRRPFIDGTTLRNDIRVAPFDRDASKWGNGDVRITGASLVNPQGEPVTWIMGGETVRMRINAVAHADKASVLVGFTVKDRTGQSLFGDNNYLRDIDRPVAVRAGDDITAHFDFRMPVLPGGTYFVAVATATGTQADHVMEEWIDEALRFESLNYQSIQGLLGIPMHDIRVSIAPQGPKR
jgi:lipopolysaccharide transport system ATP-binding protein